MTLFRPAGRQSSTEQSREEGGKEGVKVWCAEEKEKEKEREYGGRGAGAGRGATSD